MDGEGGAVSGAESEAHLRPLEGLETNTARARRQTAKRAIQLHQQENPSMPAVLLTDNRTGLDYAMMFYPNSLRKDGQFSEISYCSVSQVTFIFFGLTPRLHGQRSPRCHRPFGASERAEGWRCEWTGSTQ